MRKLIKCVGRVKRVNEPRQSIQHTSIRKFPLNILSVRFFLNENLNCLITQQRILAEMYKTN